MATQENQTIKWYNYWRLLKPIRRQTIKNITAGENGNTGEWTDDGGTMHHVAKASLSDEMWTLIWPPPAGTPTVPAMRRRRQMTPKYFSAWWIHTKGSDVAFQMALTNGQISPSGGVYRGPSGDVIVAENIAELDEEYADYVECGIVSDYV